MEQTRGTITSRKSKILETVQQHMRNPGARIGFESYVCRSLRTDRHRRRFLLAQQAASGSFLRICDSSGENERRFRVSDTRNQKEEGSITYLRAESIIAVEI